MLWWKKYARRIIGKRGLGMWAMSFGSEWGLEEILGSTPLSKRTRDLTCAMVLNRFKCPGVMAHLYLTDSCRERFPQYEEPLASASGFPSSRAPSGYPYFPFHLSLSSSTHENTQKLDHQP